MSDPSFQNFSLIDSSIFSGAEELEQCSKILNLVKEPYKNRVFAIPASWLDFLETYRNKLVQRDTEAVKPGPVDNFELVYLSPLYQEKAGNADEKFNDWSQMSLNEKYISDLQDSLTNFYQTELPM